MNIIKELYEKNLTTLGGKNWIKDNIHYTTIMGSVAYGVSSDTSDCDLYSFCIPPITDLFPHLKGEIIGFGPLKSTDKRFRVYQEHHIKDSDKEYDLSIYNIVDYFQLCMENNPNVIDSLFTPTNCVLHATRVGQLVRENRKKFLHKGSWHSFKGYAYAQLQDAKPKTFNVCLKCDKKMGKLQVCSHCKSKEYKEEYTVVGKRLELIQKYGYDIKHAYHIVRLLNEVEQILIEGDLDLTRNNDQLKSIRRGEWTLKQVQEYFELKEKNLEAVYNDSKLPWGFKIPEFQQEIRNLLIQCIEEHYGSVDKYLNTTDSASSALREIDQVLTKYRRVF